MIRIFPVVSILPLLLASLLQSADWPTWRGLTTDGLTTETQFPMKWSTTENVIWKVPLPGPGNSSPIVVKGKVFVTQAASKGQYRALLCFDRKNGEQLWERSIVIKDQEPSHKTNPYCSASPAANGDIIAVSYGSAGLYAYGVDGKKLWSRTDFGTQHHIWGNASSPLPYGDTFIQLRGPGANTSLVAVNAKTGKTVWKDELKDARGKDEKHWFGSWTTPVLRDNHGRDEMLIPLPKKLVAFDPKTGKRLWWCDGLGDLVYNNAAATGDYVMATSGYGGPALGVKAGKDASGDLTSKRLWVTKKRNPQRIGTGAMANGLYYILCESGILQCIDPKTGKVFAEKRIGKGGNWSSIVQASNRLYVTNVGGQSLVYAATPQLLELSLNPIGELNRSSMAFSDGQIFLRTYKNLWCFGKK